MFQCCAIVVFCCLTVRVVRYGTVAISNSRLVLPAQRARAAVAHCHCIRESLFVNVRKVIASVWLEDP